MYSLKNSTMKQQAEIQANTRKLIEFISRKFETGELDNNSLVEVFKSNAIEGLNELMRALAFIFIN